MADIPTTEPASFRAGDTVSWLRSVADYPPADGWTLKYSFRSSTSKFNVTASTSGTDYLCAITAATSSTIVPGRYSWIAYVVKGAAPNQEQHTVGEGSSDVTPNLSADVLYDTRTDARKIYDDLIAAFKTFASSGGRVQSYSIGGRSMTYEKAADLIQQIEHWRIIVQREEDAAMVAKGYDNPRRVGVRFRKL